MLENDLVRHDPHRTVAAHTDDPCVRRALARLDLRCHRCDGSSFALARAVPAASAASVRAASRSSGVLSARTRTPGSARLARPISVPAGRHLDDRGDPALLERLHAQVPANRVRHLCDQSPDDLRAGVHGLPVRVGDVRQCRVADAERGGQCLQRGDGRGHVRGVEGPGDLERPHPGLLRRVPGEGLQLFQGAGRDDLTGAVDVRRGQPEARQVGHDRVRVTAEHRRHAGRGDGGRLGHRAPAGRHEGHGVPLGEHTGEDGRGDLADAVPGDQVRGRARGVEAQLARGQQSGRDQQRLGDLRVADLVGVGLRAVVGQVESGRLGPAGEAVGRRRGGRARESGSRASERLGRERRVRAPLHSLLRTAGAARGDRDEEPVR